MDLCSFVTACRKMSAREEKWKHFWYCFFLGGGGGGGLAITIIPIWFHPHIHIHTQVHAYTKAAECSFVDFAGWVQSTIEANRRFKESQTH